MREERCEAVETETLYNSTLGQKALSSPLLPSVGYDTLSSPHGPASKDSLDVPKDHSEILQTS